MRFGKLTALLSVLCLAAACGKDASSIDVSPKKVKIYGLERSQRLSARLLDKRGEVIEVGPIAWSSAKADIVSVDTSGRLVAKREGSTSVMVKYKKLSVQVPVEVVDVKTLSVSPVQARLVGPLGTRLNLLLAVKDSQDRPVPIKPVWSSSNEKVATVTPEGIVSSAGPGDVSISAKIGDLQAVSDLKVDIKPIGRLEVKPATAIVRIGDSQRFEIIAYGPDGLVIEGAYALFESSNSSVATVDGSGLATGLSAGAAVIKAQLGGATAEATLLVNATPGSNR